MTEFDDIIENGFHSFDDLIRPDLLDEMYRQVLAARSYGRSLFLSEDDFDINPQFRGVNPRAGRNFLERFEKELTEIEGHPILTSYLSDLLGPNYQVMDKKMICGVPYDDVPEWLRARIEGNHVNNLGPYIKPDYRDMTYFWGIDLHQDLIDWTSREADFITLYIYIHPVGPKNSPLFILPKSHAFGATIFPHAIEELDSKGGIRYGDGNGRTMDITNLQLHGPTGTTNLWHPCTLHGTRPNKDDQERFSLRYLIVRDPAKPRCGIDAINEAVDGPLSLDSTREDLKGDGSSALKGNSINELNKGNEI